MQTHQHANNLSAIANDPLNAPYKLLYFALAHVRPHSIFFARLSSVVVALVTVGLFFAILYRWHGRRTALLGTALFATSGWLLHVGRLGTGQSAWLIVPLALILLGSWLHATIRHERALILGALVLGCLLLVPGGVWFVVAFVVLLGDKLKGHWAEAASGARAFALLILLAFIALMSLALFRDSSLVRAWLGLPAHIPDVLVIVRQWLASVVYLFVRGPQTPELWLAHTPILDIFTSVVCLLGSYFYLTHYRNLRTRTLVVFAALGSVLVALNGAVAMSFIVPLAYLVAATGVTYLLHEWLRVFPRNPVARGVGIALIALAIVCAVGYHVLAYFVAWHHSPVTWGAFQQNLLQ